MTAMVVAGGVLLVLGLAFVVVPLLRAPRRTASGRAGEIASLYREQLAQLKHDREAGLVAPEHYEPAAAELKRRMLRDAAPDGAAERASPVAKDLLRWALPALIGAFMPLAAVLLYLQLGSPQAVRPPASSAQIGAQDVEAMVERLAARMKENPDDVRGWTMLGRSYQALGRYMESAAAYERAIALAPNEPDLLASFAATLHMAQVGAAAERVAELAARALAIEPEHHAALAFAGGAAYERGDYASAIRHWERLQKLLQDDSELSAAIRDRLSEARSKLAGRR